VTKPRASMRTGYWPPDGEPTEAERAAATAKLKRCVEKVKPGQQWGASRLYVDGFEDALRAVVRAWEEET
jgi:predicted lipid-binding transport protein (Tim44 family)